MLERLTILPHFSGTICAWAARDLRKAPRRPPGCCPSARAHLEQQVVAQDAGVVHEDADRSEFGLHALGGGEHGLLVADVTFDADRATAGLLDLGHDILRGVLGDVDDGHNRHPLPAARPCSASDARPAPVTTATLFSR